MEIPVLDAEPELPSIALEQIQNYLIELINHYNLIINSIVSDIDVESEKINDFDDLGINNYERIKQILDNLVLNESSVYYHELEKFGLIQNQINSMTNAYFAYRDEDIMHFGEQIRKTLLTAYRAFSNNIISPDILTLFGEPME
jgi:hypothetical protein